MIRRHEQTVATPPEPLLLTARQAAKMLAISERTLWSLSHSGQLPRIATGRLVRYALEDLRSFIARKRVEGQR